MADQWDTHKDVLALIKTKIGGCFGAVDLEFAMHKFEEDRAKDLRAIALTNKVVADEVVKIAGDFLVRKGCTTEHIEEQIPEIKKFFGKLGKN